MKRETYLKKIRVANDLMFYIYTHIESDINLDELASSMHIDKFYLHKIFKEVFGRNIYESIKSIRLQKASNLLLTNQYSTISQIADSCGYNSQTSFIRAFKERFGMTPKAWRNGGSIVYSNTLIENQIVNQGSISQFEGMQPTIVKQPSLYAYYIRDRGYGAGIKRSWQQIQTLIYTHDLSNYQLISLFHDNPAITPLSECQHVAAITIDKEIKEINLPKFKIADGVYAVFKLEGEQSDLLRFIQWVYHDWLPKSGYETTTKPPYAIYHKNHHLSEDGRFSMDFYLSITL
ncbi:MAG TPA: GyrI-like domain-containing protein [Sulfurovum sp.]